MGILFVSITSGSHLTGLVRQVSAPEASLCLPQLLAYSWLHIESVLFFYFVAKHQAFPSLSFQCFRVLFSELYVLCFDFPQLASLFISVCYHLHEKKQARQPWPVNALCVG